MNKILKMNYLKLLGVLFLCNCGTMNTSTTQNSVDRLNDTWYLTSINKVEIDLKEEKERPELQIEAEEKKVVGKGVCNRLFGTIDTITPQKIKFGKMATSMMMCPNNMELESRYTKLLEEVREYKIEGVKLSLKDSIGNTIMEFKSTIIK